MVVWEPRCNLIMHIQVVINWQLSKQGIRWPVTTWPYRGLRYRPIEVEYFLRLSADKLLVFKWSQAQVHFLLRCTGNKLCLWAVLITFWFQTDLGRENWASFYRYGRQLLLTHHGYALVTLYVQCLCSEWSKLDWQVHAENLCSIWKLVYW